MIPAKAFGGSVLALALCLTFSGVGFAQSKGTGAFAAPGDRDVLYKTVSLRTPSAFAGPPQVVRPGETVRFHGHGTSPQNQILEYTWDFEADGITDYTSKRSGEATHVFTRPGEYDSVLKVRDGTGQTARSVCRVKVGSTNESLQTPVATGVSTKQTVNAPDGVTHRYAILFNGGGEDRYWVDMTLCYAMLTDHYGFSPADIFLLNYDGQANGVNPNGMIDYPATLNALQTVISNLATITDLDDEVFFCITDHGRGYSGSGDPDVFGYLDGRASVDPGDEPDYPESNFKLRSLMTGGDYIANHGMNTWQVFESTYNGVHRFYRHKYVSHFTNLYVETIGTTVSDNDVWIERLVDYARGDLNKDGCIDSLLGEVMDYDGDGVPPYNPSTREFDEGDWGNIDEVQDYDYVNTIVPDGEKPYRIFDSNFEGKLCIDLGYTGGEPHVDGRDEDGLGWFDWIDANQDGDTNDMISIDESICAVDGNIYDDDLRDLLNQLSVAKITIVAEPCFSGGLVEDLSSTNRIICTATTEEALSWGDTFIRGFIEALNGAADTDSNGAVSMLEAFNFAVKNDSASETPQYDDNGDKISHAGPIPTAGDGLLGANTYLSGGTVSNLVNEWTKLTSGSWEEPYWSANQLPARGQGLVALRNAGWKAVAITRDTAVNHPEALAVDNLTIEAPADSFNMLLLNYAGLDVPLVVDHDLIVGTNGSLVSHYSSARGCNFHLNSTAMLLEGSQLTFANVVVGAEAAGQLSLTNSSLWAGSLMLGAQGATTQSGGSVNTSALLMSAGSSFALSGTATLTAPLIDIGPNAMMVVEGGSVSNAQTIVLRSGCLRVDGLLHLGKLQVLEGTNNGWVSGHATLYAGPLPGWGDPRTVLRFEDSHDLLWSGSGLSIVGWKLEKESSPGDHVFVGTSSQGLNALQLATVDFVDPAGWPQGNYPAQILSTGELVPVAPTLTLKVSATHLVLSWKGLYQLCSSTNVDGVFRPISGAVSPYTNNFDGQRQFFRLMDRAR